MKNIKYFIFTLLGLVFSFSASSKDINDFHIDQNYLSNNKISVANVSQPTPFRFLVQVTRKYLGPDTYEDGACTITAVLENGSTYTNISSAIQFSTADFVNINIKTDDAIKGNILATIPANTTSGTVRLKLEYYDYNTQTNVIKYSAIGFGISLPPVVPPPTFVLPVTGCVPVYEYVSTTGKLLTKAYSSSLAGYTYERIFGFLFETQVANTVPLFAFKNNTVANDRYYGLSNSTKTGYTYQGILGYVYTSQIFMGMPVYEHYSSSGGGSYRFENNPNSYTGYTNNDIKFFILQNKQPSLNPIPDDETAEFYQYFNSGNVDHYYTTVKKDYGGWLYEKVLAYVSRIPRQNMIPLYQYFNPLTTDHYYPTVKQNYGDYRYEGIAGYVYPTSGYPGTTPIYSYWHGTLKNHYYDPNNGATGPQYQNEGIKFYMQQYPY